MAWTLKKMDPVLKTEWLAALRSGKYMQGRGFLRTGKDEFCCLGVLCDIVDKKNGTSEWKLKKKAASYSFMDMTTNLPERLEIATGVAYHGGFMTIEKKLNSLAAHNDDGKTFAQIADAIEKNL